MGKGFMAAEGLYGQDLGDILQEACERRVSTTVLQDVRF